ncbi:deoxyguanosinetriphosphate triphosphohydrolase-like protein [Ditylenchus destructor]|nr:deoxyguanosinetriphosphate triphosphohydrolase-like protein [Ditylenchus destructor]
MKAHGGFEHNLQSLRVVDKLEQRYPAFDGLNLSFESREGILKHCTKRDAQRIEEREPGGVASRFLVGGQPSLEAQLCNLADEVAYNAHDVDDGVRSGLVTLEQLEQVPLVHRYLRDSLHAYPELGGKRLLAETIRRMLSQQVYDIIDATRAALETAAPRDADEARQAGPLVRFSPEMRHASTELKRFLFATCTGIRWCRRSATAPSRCCGNCSSSTSATPPSCPRTSPMARTTRAPAPTTSPG